MITVYHRESLLQPMWSTMDQTGTHQLNNYYTCANDKYLFGMHASFKQCSCC